MTEEWGDGSWGTSAWGTDTFVDEWGFGRWGIGEWNDAPYVEENYEQLVQQWPFDTVQPTTGNAIDNTLLTWSYTLAEMTHTIIWLNAQQRVQTATGIELDKLGREVGVNRRVGEADETLRARILVAKTSQRSDGTLDDVAAVLQIIFGESVVDISIKAKTGSPNIILQILDAVLDDIQLTKQELANVLDKLLPLNDGIEIESRGSFRLDGPDYTPPDNSGFGEGTFGTLVSPE